MSTKAESAVDCFSKGCNCAQAVFSTYAPHFGVSEQQALRIATGFGAGMARLQEVCGAVTGGVMAISAAKGMNHPTEKMAKENTYEVVRDFVDRFHALHQSILCRELLGCNLNTAEGRKEFEDRHLHDTHCTTYVRDASALVEDILLGGHR